MFDEVIDRALGHGDGLATPDDPDAVRAYATVAGGLQLTDGDAWLTIDQAVDLEEAR